MIEWRAYASLIAVRPYGETAAIIDVFTQERGRVRGLVRGGQGRRLRPVLQKGAGLDVVWKARLATQLGTFRVEPVCARAAIMGRRLQLAALNALLEALCFGLPEHQPYPELFQATEALLEALDKGEPWFDRFLGWELMFLRELGFGLELHRCAVSGAREDLCYISPKTGVAVSRGGAGRWADRLLPFPPALRDGIGADIVAFRECLAITEHFLINHLIPHLGGNEALRARQRLVQLIV